MGTLAAAEGVGGSGPLAFSVRDAAARTSAHEYDIRCAFNRGDLQAKRVGKRLIIPAAALSSWVESLDDVS